jgi:hypothetical protein
MDFVHHDLTSQQSIASVAAGSIRIHCFVVQPTGLSTHRSK